MQTETTLPGKARTIGILWSYNYPFVLWLLWTGVTCVVDLEGYSLCLSQRIFGVCFGCGLTHEFARLLKGAQPHGILIYPVLALFLLNFCASLHVVARNRIDLPTPIQRAR